MTRAVGQVIVVGAGIAGLSAAFRLQHNGFDVTVLEAAPRVGGKMAAVQRDGFTINRGAALLPGTYREFARLAGDAGVGTGLTALDAAVGVVQRGTVHRLRASGLGALVDGARTDLLSRRGKWHARRLVVDALRARRWLGYDDPAGRARTDVESVGQYCDRRLTPEIRDSVVEPLLHGLFLADAMNASVTDLFFVLTRMLGKPLNGTPAGIDFVCRAIADQLGDVRTNAEVTGIERVGGGARITWQHDGGTHEQLVDGCVVAVPGPTAAKLYPGLDPQLSAIITDRLRHLDSLSARFALTSVPAQDCLAIVVPRGELGGLATVVQEHVSAPGCVPPGKGLLATFWGADWCGERMHLDDDAIVAQMLEPLDRLFPGIAGNLDFAVVDRWSPANPAFGVGNHGLFAEIDRLTDPTHRVQLAGDYLGLPLVEACVTSGRDAATRLAGAIRA